METIHRPRVDAIRALISEFLQSQLDEKLDELKEGDTKRAKLRLKFEYATWIDDAANRSVQIQAVTHSLKPIHPSAKGTNVYTAPSQLPDHGVVGTHCLCDTFEGDVAGNAAALDVYKFLKLSLDGRSLLDLAVAGDADLAAALTDDAEQARSWLDAFAGVAKQRGRPASHTLAKQFYWLTGEDAHDDTGFHLLAPLYATSLAHRVYQTVQLDRFGDEAKAAWEARKAGRFHPRPVREYGELAVQKLGGTKPLNISQLNSERLGRNYLLASLPPVWKTVAVQPVHGVDSVFQRYGRRREVVRLVRMLRDFLASDPAPNIRTRTRIDTLVADLLDELLHLAAEVRSLDPGWSQDPACRLSAAERLWLDPGAGTEEGAAAVPITDEAAERIAAGFANWLNARLRKPLPMGDPEYQHWRKLALEQIEDDLREAHDE